MKINSLIKTLFPTILFILIIELASLWGILGLYIEIPPIIEENEIFLNGLFQFLIVIIFLQLSVNVFEKIKLETTSWKFIFFAFVLGVIFPFIQRPLSSIYNLIFNSNYIIEYELFSDINWSLNLFASIIFIPISEELFFRGYLQRKLQVEYSKFFSILVASIFFAAIHLPYEALFFDTISFSGYQSFIVFFGGLISGTLFAYSKSILPSVVFHIVWNLSKTIF